jgi:hypothetical protein
MPGLDSSANSANSSEYSNNVSHWSDNSYSTNNSNNCYCFDHLHDLQENTSNNNDNKSVEDLDNYAVDDTNKAEAHPLPVRMIIDANPRPNLLARLTVEYLFINQLQGFTTTQRTILERCLRNLDLLADWRLTQSTKLGTLLKSRPIATKKRSGGDYSL